MSYSDLVKSNWGFISSEQQEKISQTRVLLAGCGLGSNIAVLAARTGFTKFTLADGDVVEAGNLNRQAFRTEQCGRNKAGATAELIREINPRAEIEVFPRFISNNNEVAELVTGADQIVNMVDPSPVLFEINRLAAEQDKPSYFPLNIGFGTAVFVFTKNSYTLEQMLPSGHATGTSQFFFSLVMQMSDRLPGYLQDHAGVIQKVMNENLSIPQLGIAAGLNASLTVTAMLKYAAGIPVPVAPDVINLDTWAVTSSDVKHISKK